MTTNKKTLRIFVVAGIVALASVAAITTMTMTDKHEFAAEPTDVSFPYEVPHWQGVPTLAMNLSPSDKTDYHELDAKEYSWLQRLVDNDETIVNDKEIREFFDIADGNYLFKVNGEVYTIHYADNPTVRLDQHYVKVIPLDDLPQTVRIVEKTENSWLQKGLSNPYKWVEVSSTEAKSYQTFTADDRNIAVDGTGYNVRYLGPLLPELEKSEHFDIYKKSIGIFEEIDGHE